MLVCSFHAYHQGTIYRHAGTVVLRCAPPPSNYLRSAQQCIYGGELLNISERYSAYTTATTSRCRFYLSSCRETRHGRPCQEFRNLPRGELSRKPDTIFVSRPSETLSGDHAGTFYVPHRSGGCVATVPCTYMLESLR
jgi:hypothetical protein